MIIAIAIPAALVAAPMGGSGKMDMVNMPIMKAHMAEMKADMGKMAAAGNDGERMQMMQAHMIKMHDHMEMMSAQGAGMHAGAAATEAPSGDAQGQHDHEAVE